MMKRKLLIVDDEESLSSSLAAFLNIKGYEVVTAANGDEGIEKIRDFNPELLLLDLHLSEGLTGIDVLKKAISIKPDLKAIILTGFGEEEKEVKDKCHRLGAVKFLPKPLTANEIKEALDAIP